MPTPKQINPFFPTNGVIEDSRFVYGRDKDIKEIFEWLNDYCSVSIVGDRGVGKSSLLKTICQQSRTYLKQSREPIYINLQVINSTDEFYAAICDGIGIEFCEGYYFYRKLKLGKYRLLLVIDEIERMFTDGFSDHVLDNLRGLAEGMDSPCKLVLASATSLDELFSKTKRMTSPLEGICIVHNLKKWDEETSRDFINSRLNCFVDTTITFEENEISELIDASEGHPQKLMESCHRLFKAKQIL